LAPDQAAGPGKGRTGDPAGDAYAHLFIPGGPCRDQLVEVVDE
jgi:hypothetical protein